MQFENLFSAFAPGLNKPPGGGIKSVVEFEAPAFCSNQPHVGVLTHPSQSHIRECVCILTRCTCSYGLYNVTCYCLVKDKNSKTEKQPQQNKTKQNKTNKNKNSAKQNEDNRTSFISCRFVSLRF